MSSQELALRAVVLALNLKALVEAVLRVLLRTLVIRMALALNLVVLVVLVVQNPVALEEANLVVRGLVAVLRRTLILSLY